MLRALIETYLRCVGFQETQRGGYTFWIHPELSGPRPLQDALIWWMGREEFAGNPEK